MYSSFGGALLADSRPLRYDTVENITACNITAENIPPEPRYFKAADTMRLGLFGGTFDPIHYGHLLAAECCREQCRLDAVWLMPTAVSPHKTGSQLSTAQSRVEMAELAVAGHDALSVCRHEVDRGGVSYTVDTLEHFRQAEPDRELFLLMGADMLNDLRNWRDAGRVCQLAMIVAVQRAGMDPIDLSSLAEVASAERIDLFRSHQVQMPQVEISASEIRRRVAAGKSIRYQTPRAVEEYIASQGLYRSGSTGS